MSTFANASQSFLLALSALFSIVNPLGSALIFSQVTASRTHAERSSLAKRIALYSALVMMVALWAGAEILNFFGVTVAALRIAGGLVVAVSAWGLLTRAQQHEDEKHEQANEPDGSSDIAFFPLTMPFTTGPGTISVAIALGSNLPVGTPELVPYVAGSSLAAIAVAAMVWIAYGSADRITAWLGASRARVLGRLFAFLLLCIGTQITLNGFLDALRGVLHP